MPLVLDNITSKEKLYFYECDFEAYSEIKNCEFYVITFNSCRFKENLFKLISNKSSFLSLSSFVGKELYVNGDYNRIISDKLEIKKCVLKDVNCEYSQYKREIHFRNNKIEELSIKVLSLFSPLIIDGGVYKSINFIGTFDNSILIKERLKVEYLNMESSLFKGRIDIKDGDFEYINFYRSSFNGLIWVNGYDILKNTPTDLEIKDINFHSCSFEPNVSVDILKIESISLSNNNFKKLFRFNSKITEDDYKGDCILLGLDGTNQGVIIIQDTYADISISGVNLGNIYFKDIKVYSIYFSDFQNNGSVSFSNIIAGGYFTVQNSSVGKLEFLNTDFRIFDEIVISDSNLEKINFSNYPFKIRSYSSSPKMGYGTKNKSLSSANLKNVYNQLKKSAKNKGDIDTANKYQSLEYRYLLRNKRFGFDKLLLFLNWISNNHGRNWVQGILFTLSIALICFYGYMYALGEVGIYSSFFGDYIIFISSFPKLELEKYSKVEKTWNLSLIIWISRIFVAYGIYQTIAAFRKYGKG
ncbi:hypothetical protein [Aquimarina macrocephali]|uniref:hypothetical protein n=1 Tax=Aquimarina macrocephali TaxID=666563 RepID=UPI0004675B62|nr:hypothetical protein [Aquimarina macrocephali]